MLPATKLQPGRTLIIDGPASVRLIDGEASCFGGLLVPNRLVLVKRERRIPVESITGASLDVKTGEDAILREIQGSTMPGSWVEAGQIVQQARGTIVVLGDVDSGKSSLSTYLANVCYSSNLTVTVVDADIGQADIGPPTTVSAASLVDVAYSLQDLTPKVSFFVGDTSPSLVTEKVSRGASMVRSHLPSTDVTIVNTDGWIEGPEGLAYKLQLLKELRPNIVLGLGVDPKLDPILDAQNCTVLKLGQSEYARTRNREERKRSRELGYKKFLDGSKRRELKLDELSVRPFNRAGPLDILTVRPLRGILTGLIGSDGMLLGISRLVSVRTRKMSVETKVEDIPSAVELGAVRLSSDYEEYGFAHM
jgi:polynucleotide 5'-hydroxyl-kinase GRC3/NOL9